MSDPILADIPSDGELFEPEEAKTDEQATEKPAGSPPEESVTEKAPSQGGAQDGANSEEIASSSTPDDSKIPFNKHPRFKEVLDQNASMREELEALKNTVGSLTPALESINAQREELKNAVKVPKLFKDLYGENAEAEYKEFKEEQDAELKKVQQSVLQKIEADKKAELATKQAQIEETKRWDAWVVSSMEKVGEQFGNPVPEGSSERNEFFKFMEKYKPTDNEGNIDFILGYELFSQSKEAQRSKKVEKTNVRKTIAGLATSGTAEPKTEYLATHKTLRNKTMREIALESLNEQ